MFGIGQTTRQTAFCFGGNKNTFQIGDGDFVVTDN